MPIGDIGGQTDQICDRGGLWGSTKRAESIYLEKADAVVAASSVLVDKAAALGARGPIHHIPNGVDLCLFEHMDGAKVRKGLEIPGKVVGSIANYDRPPELDKVIDAAKALADSEDIILEWPDRGAA